jgi:hypothetical protein
MKATEDPEPRPIAPVGPSPTWTRGEASSANELVFEFGTRSAAMSLSSLAQNSKVLIGLARPRLASTDKFGFTATRPSRSLDHLGEMRLYRDPLGDKRHQVRLTRLKFSPGDGPSE